jgi:hypothetical protein
MKASIRRTAWVLVAGAVCTMNSTRTAAAGQVLSAEVREDRIVVRVEGQVFTEYLFSSEEKYPYFFPVNGPLSGRSVTTRRSEPYPHHSSLFFGCDRVNGGNYWQEGNDRGQILSQSVRLAKGSGAEIVIEQTCRWERPGAPSPFDDARVIRLRAPSLTRREIDFDIILMARGAVKILKTNHSLFAARMASDLSVSGGGRLINAAGDSGERGTFGRSSWWADYRGDRADGVEGLAILCHTDNRWSPPPWFTRDYGFFSPTPMNWLSGDEVEFSDGERLELRYRVVVHADDPAPAELEGAWRDWTNGGETGEVR